MGSWLRRLTYVLRQSRHDTELREEIEAHRALRAAHMEWDGLPPERADDASRRAIGNVLLAREDARQVWLGSWDTWWQDVRYGLRTFRRNPTFTAVAIATLALGIGVNTGLFTVINAVLLRDASAPDSHELVSISQTVQGAPDLVGMDTFSTSEYFAYRDRAQTLSVAAFGNAMGEATLGGDTPRKILGTLVSCNFFAVLRQPPVLGRSFAPHDCEPGATPVVVLDHELWRTAFAADPAIVGRTIQLNRQRVTVAGVAADDTYNPSPLRAGYIAPLTAGRLLASNDTRYGNDRALWLNLLGRRQAGAGVKQVRAELDVIAAQIDREQPGRSTRLTIGPAGPALGRQTREAAMGAATVLMAAFGLVLLIACANVANLLLARGTARSQEIGIRASLGASRARVVRQLVTESVLMSLGGGLVGSVVAVWSFQTLVARAVPAMLPPWFPLALSIDVRPDGQVLSFAVVLTLATGVLFGLAPALHVSKPNLHAFMKQDAAGTGSGRRSGRLRGTLVGVQVALCMVLLIAAGLLLRGLRATYTIDPGFEYRDVALVSLESAFDGYSREEAEARRRRLVAGVEALPGVAAVAAADHKPLGDDMSPFAFRLPGESERQARIGERITVTDDYFAVLELPIVRGRAFTAEEVRRPGPAVAPAGSMTDRATPAILSETTARNLWPGGDPINRTLLSAPVDQSLNVETLQVVGVVADAQLSALGRIDPYYVYVPGDGAALLVKSRGGLAATVSGIRDAARAIDPTLLLTILPLEASLGWSRGISRTVTTLFGGLGVLALVLASVGIYGVVSYSVTGRYREIGVRMALGATPQNVLAMILRQTMRPVIAGAAVGVAGASAMSGVLTSVLFGISPADPIGLGGGALLLLGVALAAGFAAARPATRTDPTATLRNE
ncbi:MAG TPA: ABC transporter permease [Vicinamibacterales bacterium]|nr:ABC transporter permease [Vicinamibacterales bacterium]